MTPRKFRHLTFLALLCGLGADLGAQAKLTQQSKGVLLNRFYYAGGRGLWLEYPVGNPPPAWVEREAPFRFWHRLDFSASPGARPEGASETAEPQWRLWGSDARPWMSWNREPSAEAVRDVIAGRGWKGRLERLDEIVQEAPGLVEARLAALTEAGVQFVNQVPVKEKVRMDEALAARRAELEARLSWLHTLSGWPHLPLPSALGGMLGELSRLPEGFAPEPSLLESLRQDLLEALRRDPTDRMLNHLGGGLLASLNAAQLEALVGTLNLPPGTPLPWSLGRLLPEALAKAGAWARLESTADRALLQLEQAWAGKVPIEARLSWEAARLAAQMARGQVRPVRERVMALSDSDPGYKNLATVVEGLWASGPEAPRLEMEGLHPTDFAAFRTLLPSTVVFRHSPEALSPIQGAHRLSLCGTPVWKAEFQRLRSAPALDAWSPAELQVTELPANLKAQATARLEGQPGWVLWSEGEGLRAWGAQAPTALGLRDQLLMLGTPRLEVLSAFLRRNPDHLAARRERHQRLLERMPHPRLDVLLLEDAVALNEAPAKAEWSPSPLWADAAIRQLPRAVQHLRAFPGDPGAWKAWLFWSEFTVPGDPVAMAQSLVFSPVDRGEPLGSLREPVFLAVLKRLEDRGRTREAGLWARYAFEGFLKTGLEDQILRRELLRDLEGSQQWARERATEVIEGVVRPMAEALRRGGQGATLLQLEAILRALKPGLEKLAQPKGR